MYLSPTNSYAFGLSFCDIFFHIFLLLPEIFGFLVTILVENLNKSIYDLLSDMGVLKDKYVLKNRNGETKIKF